MPGHDETVVKDHGGGLDNGSDSEATEYDENARTSAEIRRHDYDTLTAEEEAEEVLLRGTRAHVNEKAGGLAGRLFRRNEKLPERDHDASVRVSRKSRRQRRRSGRKPDSEEASLMYEMEEARRRESAESSGNSSEVDLQKLGEVAASQKVWIELPLLGLHGWIGVID